MNPLLMSLLIIIALAIFGRTMVGKIQLLRALEPIDRANHLKERLKNMVILAIGFGLTGLAHLFSDGLAGFFQEKLPFLERFSLTSQFFWLIVLATSFGLILSFTKARNYEGAGASRIGSVFIYFLVELTYFTGSLSAIENISTH